MTGTGNGTGATSGGRRALRLASAAVAVLAVPATWTAAGAADPPPFATSSATRYQVTLVARGCENYAAVTANPLRGDPNESLVRAGRTVSYQPGQPVNPDTEAVAADGCRPLVGWRFTFGSGRDRKGALSVVTGATVASTPTVARTPRLDDVGRPTGQTLEGGVTGTLTDEQVRLAVRRQLWVQGGTPDDPLLAKAYKGYSFGALRCGVDAHTAGNVQWVAFAPGARHAFCFAYYAHTAPTAGSVTLRVLPTRPVGYPQRFGFLSDLSQSAGGAFAVSSAGEAADATFTRVAGATYPAQLQLPAGWHIAGLTCAAAHSGRGRATSTTTPDPATGRVSVTLAAGDAVTCTYAVDPPVTGSGLALRVFSENGAGTFGVSVDGPGGVRTLSAAPSGDGNAATPTGADLSTLTEGRYTVRVTPPGGADASAWTLSAVTCGGRAVPAKDSAVVVSLLAGVPLECGLRVTHTAASLKLRMVTSGGVATGGFAVVHADQPVVGWAGSATTTGYGTPATATGDVPAQVPFGAYLLTAIPPASTVDGGWQLTSFVCSGGQPAAANGATLRLTLATAAPDATCTASYQLVPSTRLQVMVRVDGAMDARAGSAIAEVTCDDGSAGRVVLPAQNTVHESLPDGLSFLEPTSCTITQPSSGAVDGGGATASVVLDPGTGGGGPLSLPARLEVSRDVPEYTVTLTDHYTAADSGTGQVRLLRPFQVLPVALIGIGMVTLGALVLVGLFLRRRASYNTHRTR
jgi:hypothetical protein